MKSSLKNNHQSDGFTLIELMVVISIIALMSTVALSALSSSKVNARNTKRLQIVRQYANALELYRNDNTTYPVYGDGGVLLTSRLCLGEASTNACQASTHNGNAALNTELRAYIPGPPASIDKVMFGTFDFHGITYSICPAGGCTCPLGSGCPVTAYQLEWYMEGDVKNCAGGTKWSGGVVTRCTYP